MSWMLAFNTALKLWPRDIPDWIRFSQNSWALFSVPKTSEYRTSCQNLLFSWPLDIPGGQEGVSGVPHPNLYPNSGDRHTQTYRHSDTPLKDTGTDPLHPSGTGNMVFLKDAAETSWHAVRSHFGCGVQELSTSHRRPSLSPHTTSTLKDGDGWKPGRKVPSQEPGRCKLSGEACTLQVLGQHPALLAGLL